MLTISWLGSLSLNLSLVIYLVLYIPQIIHNHKPEHLAQLSVGLHGLLFLSYSCDLVYGFAAHLPWQYKTVSITGLLLLTVQHVQLLYMFLQLRQVFLIGINLAFLIVNAIGMCFLLTFGVLNSQTIILLGAVARLCGLLYCLPQIIKNKRGKCADALSIHFIYLNLCLALLDTLSSWCLGWPWPNKLAAPITLGMMLYLLFQTKKYSKKGQFQELLYDI